MGLRDDKKRFALSAKTEKDLERLTGLDGNSGKVSCDFNEVLPGWKDWTRDGRKAMAAEAWTFQEKITRGAENDYFREAKTGRSSRVTKDKLAAFIEGASLMICLKDAFQNSEKDSDIVDSTMIRKWKTPDQELRTYESILAVPDLTNQDAIEDNEKIPRSAWIVGGIGVVLVGIFIYMST